MFAFMSYSFSVLKGTVGTLEPSKTIDIYFRSLFSTSIDVIRRLMVSSSGIRGLSR